MFAQLVLVCADISPSGSCPPCIERSGKASCGKRVVNKCVASTFCGLIGSHPSAACLRQKQRCLWLLQT